MTPGYVLSLVGRTVREPREVATEILSLGLPRAALLPLLGLVVLLGVFLSAALGGLVPPPPVAEGETAPSPMSPIVIAAVAAVVVLLNVWLITTLGRKAGGTGRFDEALALNIFLQFAFTVGEIPYVLLLATAPPLSAVYMLALVIFAVWINVEFTDVLHGFGSRMKAFFLILAVVTLMAIGLFAVLALFGTGLEAPTQ